MIYRPEVDGLRAIAVASVILFHAGLSSFSGGYVGVDVFFVISGYFITAVISNEFERGEFTYIGFLERRIRRLLPSLYLMALVTTCFVMYWFLPRDIRNYSATLVSTITFGSNIYLWLTSGYFDSASELKPLLHTWSLSIEEQFYFVYPFLLLTVLASERRIKYLFVSLFFLLSLWLSYALTEKYQSLAFYLLPTRVWEFLLGAIVYYISKYQFYEKLPLIKRDILSCVGLTSILFAVFVFDSNTSFPGLWALIPTLGTAFVIAFATADTKIAKILAFLPFRWVGAISYSAYLWHQPIFSIARYRANADLSNTLISLMVVGTFILSYITTKYFELPFRDKKTVSKSACLYSVAVTSLTLLSTGLILYYLKGEVFSRPSQYGYEYRDMAKVDNGYCFHSIDSIPSLKIATNGGDCWLSQGRKLGLLFGDSFAGSYEPLFKIVGSDMSIGIKSVTTNWCYPSLGDNFTGPKSGRAYQQCILNRKYLFENADKYDIIILGGWWGKVFDEKLIGDVYDLVEYLSKKTKLVVIMAAPRQFDTDVFSSFEKSLMYNQHFDIEKIGGSNDLGAIRANENLLMLSNKYKNVIFVERAALFNDKGVDDFGIPYSFDGKHISIHGAKESAKVFNMSDRFDQIIDFVIK